MYNATHKKQGFEGVSSKRFKKSLTPEAQHTFVNKLKIALYVCFC